MSVLTNENITVDCIVVGKPLVAVSTVNWAHASRTDLDLTKYVNTVKGTDDYTLISTLHIPNPPKNYSGIFKCNVQDEDLSKSVDVSIHCEFALPEILISFIELWKNFKFRVGIEV